MIGQLALTLVYLGYIDQARSKLNEAMSKARQLKQAATLAEVLLCANWFETIIRSPRRQRYAEELLTLSTEYGFPYYSGWAIAFNGWSLAALGRAQQGLRLLSQGLMAVRATANIASTPALLVGLAEVYAMLGQPLEGLKGVTEAAQIIETTDERVEEVELHRLRGELLNATGDRPAAEQSYHRALAVARRQSAKLFELRAATSLARLWCDQNKRAEARDLLALIYGWFTEGFDTPVLQEAKALLDQLA
jgi:predicted ATPase